MWCLTWFTTTACGTSRTSCQQSWTIVLTIMTLLTHSDVLFTNLLHLRCLRWSGLSSWKRMRFKTTDGINPCMVKGHVGCLATWINVEIICWTVQNSTGQQGSKIGRGRFSVKDHYTEVNFQVPWGKKYLSAYTNKMFKKVQDEIRRVMYCDVGLQS